MARAFAVLAWVVLLSFGVAALPPAQYGFGIPRAAGPWAAADEARDVQQARVRKIQQALTHFGYTPGPADGLMGERTRRAMRYYQRDHGLDVDGQPSAALLSHMEAALATRGISLADSGNASDGAAQPTGAAEPATLVTDVTLKSMPDADAADGAQVAAGTLVNVVARQGGWMQIRAASGEHGWVRLSAVRLGDAPSGPEAQQPGGFMRGLARGITSLFGTAGSDEGGATTATIGIRGLSKEALAAALPNPEELAKLERYRATETAAQQFAGQRKLSARPVAYLPEPERGQKAAGSGLSAPRK